MAGMPGEIQLTPEQEAVVAHETGPALVFAVAGAGKTTAMVHRIRRLVESGVFSADQILATSFARKNAADLRESLAAWPTCRSVHVTTLHALGRGIIQLAGRQGLHPTANVTLGEDGEGSVLARAIHAARQENVPYRQELETLDRADFLSYVAACKGDLAYADLDSARLPAAAHRLATQVSPLEGPLSYYPDLYRRFERQRQREGLVTFADMLLTGWELLIRHEALLHRLRDRIRCVLVDEFQDVNRAQAEMLDVLTAPDRHYMAIGDDDQTIYEWRGARPRFILSFAERYGAVTYQISENFRCPAGPLVLPNRVIAHNRRRQPKQLRLTQGFAGATTLETCRDGRAQARDIVARVQTHQAAGGSLKDVAVLLRLNAQTPPIEQALIAAGIPYTVSTPFYARIEITTLVDYVRAAWLQKHLSTGQSPTPAQAASFGQAWQRIVNRPKRYVSRTLAHSMASFVTQHSRPPAEVLRAFAEEAPSEGVSAAMDELAAVLAWLAASLKAPAKDVLQELDSRLGYRQFLRDTSGFAQTGEGRAEGVNAFFAFAREQGSLLDFMKRLRQLEEARVGQETMESQAAVALSTIHQAKGREWPIVFLPDCNQGLLPFVSERDFNLEEERRLFYVALTRSRRDLHLSVTQDRPASQFLAESNAAERVRAVTDLAAVLEVPPENWTSGQALTVARAVPALDLASYFERWWSAPPERRSLMAARLKGLHESAATQGLSEALGLSGTADAMWQRLAEKHNEVNAGAFADLAALASSPSTGLPAETNRTRRVRVGVWLHCEAGWGRVDAIWDASGRPLGGLDALSRRGRLSLTLRPGAHQERVELDLQERRLYFPRQARLYTCSKCDGFSTVDPFLIVGLHNDAAHGGVGARYRQEKKAHRQLRRLAFTDDPPADPFL
jgi:DNA helicase-2/ATP-dependent DNA helicase PcrA